MFMREGITVDGDRVMVGANDAKVDKKRRFGKMEVGDKKGKEVEERERMILSSRKIGICVTLDASFFISIINYAACG